jgi:hypothetical protein
MYLPPLIPPDLPGRELILAGLADLHAGRETVEAVLAATGAPGLRAASIDVPELDGVDVERRMYGLLGERDPEGAYGTYNARRRRLVSFCEPGSRPPAPRCAGRTAEPAICDRTSALA